MIKEGGKVADFCLGGGEEKMYGKPVTGIIRTTVLIGKDGKVKKIWNSVKVKGHVNEVLGALGNS